MAVLAAFAVAACGPAAAAPARPLGDAEGRSSRLGEPPQPGLATLDLGIAGPGFDGTGDFYSYESDLPPAETLDAYATQLLAAGYRDAGRNGAWRVFDGPVLTVWVRVGPGGPPTSLLVRVQSSAVESADSTDPLPSMPAATSDPVAGSGSQTGAGPKATARPITQRPDPPHASGGATAVGGTGTGGSTTGGTASGGSTGGTGTGTGGAAGTGSGGTSSGGGTVTGGGAGTGGGSYTGGGSDSGIGR